MSYLSNIYAEDFQPGELSNYEPVSNAKLEKQAVKAGVSEDVAAAAFSGKNEYLDWLTASNNYTILRPELFNSSGAFSSPTLTINGEYWDLKQLTLADTNMVDGFLKGQLSGERSPGIMDIFRTCCCLKVCYFYDIIRK